MQTNADHSCINHCSFWVETSWSCESKVVKLTIWSMDGKFCFGKLLTVELPEKEERRLNLCFLVWEMVHEVVSQVN